MVKWGYKRLHLWELFNISWCWWYLAWKKRLQISVLALAEILLSVWLADILSKTKEGLYRISHVARNPDYISWVIIPCCRAFCIKEMKSALSMLYVVNRVFSADNVLQFCFKGPNTLTSRGCNKCVESADKYEHTILCSWANRKNSIDTLDACLSTINIRYLPRR